MNADQLRECYIEADRRMKSSNGHSFVTILKTRCQYCGRSPAAKGKCSAWFQVFLDHLTIVIGEHPMKPTRCPHGYELHDLADGTSTCEPCKPSGHD